jgi:hypothetical protein
MGNSNENIKFDIDGDMSNGAVAAGNNNSVTNITINHNYLRHLDTEKINNNNDLRCPYRGLFSFTSDDAKYFYGRDIFIEELLTATKTKNFIFVSGASGIGKSSLVFAGLKPKLQAAGHWEFIDFRPGENPFHALASALIPLYTSNLDPTEQLNQSRRLASHLQDNIEPLPLGDVLKMIQKKHPRNRVLLIIDQLEEIYTLCREDKVRKNFLNVLIAGFKSSSQQNLSPVLVATMRLDFSEKALSEEFLSDVFRNNNIQIRAMNNDEIKDIIEKPAKQMGVSFEAGLVEHILNEVENQTGILPLLEFALTELWQRRSDRLLTHDAYQAITYNTNILKSDNSKGIKRALASYADNKYQELSKEEQEKAKQVFVQLVRPGEGTDDTKRLAMQEEFDEDSWNLVNKLIGSRLLVVSQNTDGQNTVEVVHEALIQHWSSLRQWIEADRVFMVFHEDLRRGQKRWIKSKKKRSSLMSGTLLEESIKYLAERSQDLQHEKDFIEKSIKAKKSDLSFSLYTLAILALLVVCIYVVIHISDRKCKPNKVNISRHHALESMTHQN